MQQAFAWARIKEDLHNVQGDIAREISQNQVIKGILNEARVALQQGKIPNDTYRRYIESFNVEAFFVELPNRIVFHIPNMKWFYQEFGIPLLDGKQRRVESRMQTLLEQIDTIATSRGLQKIEIPNPKISLTITADYTYDKRAYAVH